MDPNKKKDLTVGLVVIASIIILAWGYSFLQGRDVFKKNNDYYIKLKSSNGIVKGSPVTLKGVNVGSVNEIDLDDNYNILVKFTIPSKVRIYKNTVAEIFSPDPLNGKQIKLVFSENTAEIAEDDDTLQSTIAPGLVDQIGPEINSILPDLKSSIKNINSITSDIDNTLSDPTQRNVQSSIDNLNQASQNLNRLTMELAKNTLVLNKILMNSNAFMVNLNNNNANINRSLNNIANATDNIAQADINASIDKLNTNLDDLNSLLSKINNSQGSLGLLINDKGLYYRLNNTTESLNNLIDDIQNNPKKYINVSIIGGK